MPSIKITHKFSLAYGESMMPYVVIGQERDMQTLYTNFYCVSLYFSTSGPTVTPLIPVTISLAIDRDYMVTFNSDDEIRL